MDDVETGILKIVREFAGERANLSSELYHDLHICMDDAGELLEAIHEKYDTSFDGFRFASYFPIDGEALPRIVKWFGVKDRKFASFTVAHLIGVVRQGHWTNPG